MISEVSAVAAKPKSNIAKLRHRMKMTQLELSQKIGVTETTIANWEKNRGGGVELIERFVRLCETLQCQAHDLISYESTSTGSQSNDTSLASIHEELGVSEPAYFSKSDEAATDSSTTNARKKRQVQKPKR